MHLQQRVNGALQVFVPGARLGDERSPIALVAEERGVEHL
jgi:hypothetical protein